MASPVYGLEFHVSPVGEALQELTDGQAEPWVNQAGSQLLQGDQNEGPLMKSRMGENETGVFPDGPTVKKKIEIEGPRPPAFAPVTAEGLLHCQAGIEEGQGGEGRCHGKDSVQIGPLSRRPPDGSGLIETRTFEDPDFGNSVERGARAAKSGEAIAEVGTEPEIGRDRRGRCTVHSS
jgi:hypothetical protein